jgi:hypothetical protein
MRDVSKISTNHVALWTFQADQTGAVNSFLAKKVLGEDYGLKSLRRNQAQETITENNLISSQPYLVDPS